MARNPFNWIEIYVKEMDRRQKFYETVFQFSMNKIPSPEIEMMGFPADREGMGASGALVKMEGLEPGGNSVIPYFSCDDCSVEAGRVPDAGGRIHAEKMSIGEYGFIALAFDCEGNMFGLHLMK